MANIGTYCCFVCPAHDRSERSIDKPCPTCGAAFNFPLKLAPKKIGDFRIVKSLGRGFYAATYLAELGKLDTRYVLKVASKVVYSFFNKDFERDCREHQKVAAGAEHVVQISDYFDSLVSFGKIKLDCHIAVLNYIDGDPLDDLLSQKIRLSATAVAQIGIDLFRILDELQNKVTFHNDLHGGNIMVRHERNRAGAIDSTVRAMAVDLGSISDESKSGKTESDKRRLGDIHWIARHLLSLVDHLLRDPDASSDLDYRLASSLEEIAHRLHPSASSVRLPAMGDLVEQIRSACLHVSSPWRDPLRLQNFNDSYNAQTLAPWYVPLLLVDPNEQWLKRMSTPGPQIITGMRGCGKTLFLRALQFHARASQRTGEGKQNVSRRLQDDHFVGLYVSTSRLLDALGDKPDSLHEPNAKLYAAFALEAIRAVQHLQDVSPESVDPTFAQTLAGAVGDFLAGVPSGEEVATSAHQLEHSLIRALVSLSRGESTFSLSANPAVAFPHLAEAIRKCSRLWSNAYVLFLLDDVSTRYLHEKRIAELLSALLFQSTCCAFKITSEAQTLELVLRSPGQIELARIGRDYDVFDLGAEVYARITTRRGGSTTGQVYGKRFVEQILKQRKQYYYLHPPGEPGYLLGDATLESIAKAIASVTKTDKKKNAIYHGMTALTHVCVGDIGDVISLYELILQKAQGQRLPIASGIQSESYQEFCSRRLYDLNRRKGELKDVALSFAEASHELLVKSDRDLKAGRTRRVRLRQYLCVYVRITVGDVQWQYEKLRDLIDSGLFVFSGGSSTPRTKTKDSNPTQQFKLTYRKIYGLSNCIGLAEGDRFELSGDQLESWLRDPSKGKDVLLRNLGDDAADEEDSQEPDATMQSEEVPMPPAEVGIRAPVQPELFDSLPDKPSFIAQRAALDENTEEWLSEYIPRAEPFSLKDLAQIEFDTAIVGLGFEARAAASARRLGKVLRAKRALFIRYAEEGRAKDIEQAIGKIAHRQDELYYADAQTGELPIKAGKVLVDVSGLAKPVLFHAVRESLRLNGAVWICHTMAASYYPLDSDIAQVLHAEKSRDHYTLLTSLRRILTGEEGPYEIRSFHSSEVDASRRRILFAFASAKHERLLSLLDRRDYDQIEIVTPSGDSPRIQVAKIGADVAAKNFGNSEISSLHSNDLSGILNLLMRKYQHWYVQRGFNFDLALTGSKLQGVACAAVSAAVKISDCLYVSPKTFDKDRFTKGIGRTALYKVSLAGA